MDMGSGKIGVRSFSYAEGKDFFEGIGCVGLGGYFRLLRLKRFFFCATGGGKPSLPFGQQCFFHTVPFARLLKRISLNQ